MAYELYSEQVKRSKQEADPYQYDNIPEGLRNQIFHILGDVIGIRKQGEWGWGWTEEWAIFWGECCRRKGMPRYEDNDHRAKNFCQNYLNEKKVLDVLDIIGIAIQFATNRNASIHRSNEVHSVYAKAIEELNLYFREACVGYKVANNQIIRIDSEHLHSEVVVPALDFLRGDGFKSANKEFLSALEKYRSGDYRHCITDASSAFESVMKVICKRRGRKYGNGTASKLVEALSNERIIPGYSQKHFQEFEQLLSTLKSGLPVFRDNEGSVHGRGGKPIKAHAYMAGYAIHLAATNILFLVQAYESSSDETSDNNTSTLVDEIPS